MKVTRRHFNALAAVHAVALPLYGGTRGLTTPSDPATLFLAGDVMTGRGIDQILCAQSVPVLYEPAVSDARDYVRLAEGVNGPIPRKVGSTYIWGDALAELERRRPDARIINLETSVTTSDDAVPKGINYRMHPDNIGVITALGVDCCVLANNHVLDWGQAGLAETLRTLRDAGVRPAGAGATLDGAAAPAIIDIAEDRRILVYAFGTESSGIPSTWGATPDAPGVNFLDDLSERAAADIGDRIEGTRRPGDVVVASIHWGGNWGYRVPDAHRRFAHGLIDHAGVDIVHGHSSHHALGIEVHRERLVLYGCGDFVNDYEGIRGHREFRDDLPLMYFVSVEPRSARLSSVELVPLRMARFRLDRAAPHEVEWLSRVLTREGDRFGTRVRVREGGTLVLEWA